MSDVATKIDATRFVKHLNACRSAAEHEKIQRYFKSGGDVADTFRIAEILLHDTHDLIHKATGRWLREAGKRDRQRMVRFLDRHAATMPRTALRHAIEHLDEKRRQHYVSMKTVR